MAGRKVTVLPNNTALTQEDILYNVDVSDTSESPQGTSKQNTVATLADAVLSPTFATVTPTITSSGGSSNDFDMYFTKVGSAVSFQGFSQVVTIDETETNVEMTLEFPTEFLPDNNFPTRFEIIGGISPSTFNDGTNIIQDATIQSVADEKTIQISLNLTEAATADYLTAVYISGVFDANN